MIKRNHLRVLLYCLAVLLTLLAVLGGFNALAISIDDSMTRSVLGGALVFVVVLLAANTILLVAALAILAIEQDEDEGIGELWEPPMEEPGEDER